LEKTQWRYRTTDYSNAGRRLLKAFATQVEVQRRLRYSTGQYVRVEHVHIGNGAQAVIGNVTARNGDRDVPSST
jgi:hypothetical protein